LLALSTADRLTVVAALGCAQVTVEFQVAGFLEKPQVENRAARVARVWAIDIWSGRHEMSSERPVHDVPGAGHATQWEQPDEFNRLLAEFATDCLAASRP